MGQEFFEGKYRLGLRLFELGSVVANSWDVRRVAGPYIEKLVDELEETVHLAVLNEDRVLCIDKRQSRRSIRIVSQVGMRLPAPCSGVGKAVLAYLPASTAPATGRLSGPSQLHQQHHNRSAAPRRRAGADPRAGLRGRQRGDHGGASLCGGPDQEQLRSGLRRHKRFRTGGAAGWRQVRAGGRDGDGDRRGNLGWPRFRAFQEW